MVTNVINSKYKKQVQCAKKAIMSSVKIPTKLSKLSEFLSSSGSEFQTVGPA